MNVTPMTPLTAIKVLRGVPLKDYVNQRPFHNVSEQITYFTSKVKYSVTDASPVRINNVIRLPYVADNLYDCNYIMFQNGNFSNKWFYAFIRKVEFVNTKSCHVTIEIDSYQTWMFDANIGACYVEREHTNDDTIGSNIVDENVDTGEYYYRYKKGSGLFNTADYVIISASTIDENYQPSYGKYYNNVYSGVSYHNWGKDPSQLNGWLDNLDNTGKKDAVLGIFMIPEQFWNDSAIPKQFEFTIEPNLTTIGGYTPKNKKLFVYPYNFSILTNDMGTSHEIKYEFCGNYEWWVNTNMSINFEAKAFPKEYLGVINNYQYSININQFPMCAFTVDAYKAWLAQNQGTQALAFMSGTAGLSLGLSTGNVPLIIGSGMSVANQLAQRINRSAIPLTSKGGDGGSVEFSNGILDFRQYQVTVTEEYARIIDDYFSMYGYAIREIKVPNIFGRQSWNYVKTMNAVITGNVPQEDLKIIENMFNTGVTFWHTDNVGDYSQPNEI